MRKTFYVEKEKIVKYYETITKEEFFELIHKIKPKEIFCVPWSDKIPFIVITEYNENGMKLFHTTHVDHTPIQKTLLELYKILSMLGLDNCYIEDNREEKLKRILI